jgi:uncharacterized secreted protein with C-terminal beta-propeller domain
MEALRRANASAIRARPLADWLPRLEASDAGGSRALAVDCGRCRASTAPVALGFTTLTTLDLDEPGRVTLSGLLADVRQAYASPESLYLATDHWSRTGRDVHTYLHRFRLSSGVPEYEGSGGVRGSLLGQFSMDDEDGHLRVATTTWGTAATGSTNQVFVLRPQDGRLQVVGRTDALAEGERIFAARFEGPRGYLVTFRQVDPLFTLDLRDHTRPRVAGELKIPGFSTYLHPLGSGHLLAVGREITDTPSGWQLLGGVALQVFDVSRPDDPRLAHRHVVGTTGATGSSALGDHRAFNYFPSRGTLALPFSEYGRGGFRTWVELFRVDAQQGIGPAGTVELADVARSWAPVRRSVMMDDYVYAIGGGGVKVAPLARPDRAVAVVPFPEPGR